MTFIPCPRVSQGERGNTLADGKRYAQVLPMLRGSKLMFFHVAVHQSLGVLLAACLSICAAAESEFLSAEQRAEDFAMFCQFVEEEYAGVGQEHSGDGDALAFAA